MKTSAKAQRSAARRRSESSRRRDLQSGQGRGNAHRTLVRHEDRADLAREQSAEGRVRCLTSGMENDDIARDLVVTPRTVAKHVEHILLKLGVHSRAQAIALAFRENIAGAN